MRYLQMTICLFFMLASGAAIGENYLVPDQYDTIHEAIDACDDFDTVIVAARLEPYSGNINLRGKAIAVRSSDPDDFDVVDSTVIDCDGGKGFVFYLGEGRDTRIEGLTIVNGYGFTGGAIRCFNNTSPVISKCVIVDSSAVFGGAISSEGTGSNPLIANCLIENNSAIVGGGAIYCSSGSIVIQNSVINDNAAPRGAAIFSQYPNTVDISGSTISWNSATNSGGAVYCYNSSQVVLENSILWGNTAVFGPQVWMDMASVMNVSYCDVQGGLDEFVYSQDCTVEWGDGNINEDPGFEDLDYHLSEGSPCVDAGLPGYVAQTGETDIDGDKRVTGNQIDIGADEIQGPIGADVRLTPRNLNLDKELTKLKCALSLGTAYDEMEIDIDTITLNGEETEAVESEYDVETGRLLVKLVIATDLLEQMLVSGENYIEVYVQGLLLDGQTRFAGSDTINKAGSRGAKKYHKKGHDNKGQGKGCKKE